MQSLQPPDSHFLRAALGWLELGNWREANEELERIAPALRAHPHVLLLRYEIYAKAGKWDGAAEIARALTDLQPQEAPFWIRCAYATRRMNGGSLEKSKEILSRAQRLFPTEPLIAYNLACYECQLGNLKLAREWLEKSFAIGGAKELKLMALDDPDLEPLWAEVGKI